jgi:prolyl-tRNA synthetase
MRFTKAFAKTQKQDPKDEISINARLLIRGGYIDKLMAGVYTLLPLGLKVYKKIEQIIREEMDAIGGQELSMPAMHPRENWEITGRWDAMDDLYKLPIGDNKEAALGATHEEIVSPLAKKMINSYKDLPKYVYQFQNKFRREKRAKSGILRGREFTMKDLYSFHATQESLDEFYDQAAAAYVKIFSRCGIGDKTYFTYAGGGTFSKYSHEFQTLTSAGEDFIYICDKCRVAINQEIIADLDHKCPVCGNSGLREEKAVEVGNIFKLGTKYSAPFDLAYTDKEGNKRPVIMGCFGIGLQRLLGTIIEISHDDRGIIWPPAVSPYKVHIVAINLDKEAVSDSAEKLYADLRAAGIEAMYDDRPEISAGEKFSDADLIGCPFRVVVSEKTAGSNAFELKRRIGGDSKMVSGAELINLLAAENFQEN